MIPRRTLTIPLSLHKIKTNALIDSGALGFYIDIRFVKKYNLLIKKLFKPITVRNVDNTENIAGQITHYAPLEYTVLGKTRVADFCVTHLGKQAVILGLTWLEDENPDINWRTREIKWRDEPTRRNIYAKLQEEWEQTNELMVSFIKGQATDEA